MTGIERMWSYVEGIESGTILSNKWMKLVMKRFRADLKKSEDPSYPYEFKTEIGERIIQFAELLKQTNDEFAGQPLVLMPWQCFCIHQIYSWVRKDDNSIRKHRKAWLYITRKAGKSTMSAVFCLWDLLSTPGAQVCIAANTRAQAKIVFNVVSAMIDQNPILAKRLKQYKSTTTIVNASKYGNLTALSADSKKTSDGLNVSCGVFDECSTTDYSIYRVIESGQGQRPSPLNILISSGSDQLDSMGHDEFERACKILEGVIEDDSYFTCLYCLDEEDSWEDESKYLKCNPSLGVTVKPEFLHKLKIQALQTPSLQVEFKTKILGLWLNNEHSWINYKYWKVCSDNVAKYKFDKERPYYANLGVDLSKANDLTTLTLCLYQNEKFYLKHWLYFPKDSLDDRIKTETEVWRQWFDKGIVKGVPGKTIDYDWLLVQVQNICAEYEIEELLYDPYASTKITVELEDSMTIVPIPQNLKSLSPFTKTYEKEILDGNIVDDNDFMKWAISNAMIYEDANGNIKIIKNSRKGKSVNNLHIDPVITSLMCVGRIKSLLDAGEIDLRTPEEIKKDTSSFLASLNI